VLTRSRRAVIGDSPPANRKHGWQYEFFCVEMHAGVILATYCGKIRTPPSAAAPAAGTAPYPDLETGAASERVIEEVDILFRLTESDYERKLNRTKGLF